MVLRSRVRLSPALGIRLTSKCAWYLRRRRRPPGIRIHRRRVNEYRLHSREERLLRRQYEIRGRQLRRAFDEAAQRRGETADNLIEVLEQRLDALVWRAGFASTIHQARELVGHNHFTVDGGKVDLPSYQLHPGQTLEVRSSSRDKRPFARAAAQQAEQPPPYLDVQPERLRATLTREPRRDEVPVLRDQPLVVEVRSP